MKFSLQVIINNLFKKEMNLNNPTLQDEFLKAYIDKVFNDYDVDRSGGLDEDELTMFFNDLYKILNIQQVVTKEQSRQAIQSMDQDGNGVIDKKELFDAFKMLINKKQAPQPPQPPVNPGWYGQMPPPPPPPQYPANNGWGYPQYPPGGYGMSNNYRMRWGQYPQYPPPPPNPQQYPPQYPPQYDPYMGGSGFGNSWSKRR